MALSCAAIRRDSVSLLRFPFLSQVQVFWCEMLSFIIIIIIVVDIIKIKRFNTVFKEGFMFNDALNVRLKYVPEIVTTFRLKILASRQ